MSPLVDRLTVVPKQKSPERAAAHRRQALGYAIVRVPAEAAQGCGWSCLCTLAKQNFIQPAGHRIDLDQREEMT